MATIAKSRRIHLGIPKFHAQRRAWSLQEDSLLGKVPDEDVARQLNRTLDSVKVRRFKLRIPEDDPRRELRKDQAGSAAVNAEQQRQAAGEKPANGEDESSESSEFPEFFAVIPGGTDFDGLPSADAYHPCSEAEPDVTKARAYQRGLFLRRVQQVCLGRTEAINVARLAQKT